MDAIGGRTDAIGKAASLAGISGYDLEDINVEVSRIINEKRRRANGSLELDGPLASSYILRSLIEGENAGSGLLSGEADASVLRTLPLPGGIGEDPSTALPDFPLNINGPNAYYLYVGPSP